ncbi:MAG: hypothetical protein LBR58_02490 [Propionibacteriaceae bacterium]|nr:hypothetical protein [Propionibacteriaceae bacterium]
MADEQDWAEDAYRGFLDSVQDPQPVAFDPADIRRRVAKRRRNRAVAAAMAVIAFVSAMLIPWNGQQPPIASFWPYDPPTATPEVTETPQTTPDQQVYTPELPKESAGWERTADYPEGMAEPPDDLAWINGAFYAVHDAGTSDFAKYDPVGDTWTYLPLPPSNTDITLGTATAFHDGKIYRADSDGENVAVQVFDTNTASWELLRLVKVGAQLDLDMKATPGGILVFGYLYDQVWWYSNTSKTWTQHQVRPITGLATATPGGYWAQDTFVIQYTTQPDWEVVTWSAAAGEKTLFTSDADAECWESEEEDPEPAQVTSDGFVQFPNCDLYNAATGQLGAVDGMFQPMGSPVGSSPDADMTWVWRYPLEGLRARLIIVGGGAIDINADTQYTADLPVSPLRQLGYGSESTLGLPAGGPWGVSAGTDSILQCASHTGINACYRYELGSLEDHLVKQ